jgi:hypothetical protein
MTLSDLKADDPRDPSARTTHTQVRDDMTWPQPKQPAILEWDAEASELQEF